MNETNCMIKHITQPDSESCVPTCLAMIMDTTPEEVINKFGREWGDLKTISVMFQCGINFNKLVFPTININGWLMLSVPSLNIQGKTHMIIVEYEDGEFLEILDPNTGRENKKFYVEPNYPQEHFVKEIHCRLETWEDVYYFQPGGNIPKNE